MKFPSCICLFFSFLVWPALTSGQDLKDDPSGNRGPEDVARVYCNALTKGDATALLGVLHTESADHVGRLISETFANLEGEERANLKKSIFGDDLDDKDLSRMRPAELFASILCSDPTRKKKSNKRSPGVWNLNPNWMAWANHPGQRKVLGTVPGGEHVVHVVYHYEGMNPLPHEEFANLVTLIKVEDDWKIAPTMKFVVDRLTVMASVSKATSKSDGVTTSQ